MKPSSLFRLTFFMLFFLSLAAATQAGVLVPSDDEDNVQSNMDSVNLGIIPAPAPKKLTITPRPTDALSTDTADEAASALAKSSTLKDDGSTIATFAPGGTVESAPLTPQQKIIAQRLASGRVASPTQELTPRMAQIKKLMDETNKKYESDPTIIKEVSYEPPDDPSLTMSIAVTVMPSVTWSAAEASLVHTVLGYDADSVSQNCQIKFKAQIQTATSQYTGRSSMLLAGEQKSLKYADTDMLTAVSFQPYAVCLKPTGTVPRRGGIIMSSSDGKLYIVQLMKSATCSVESHAKSPSYLKMLYKGDGKAECAFN